MNEKLVRDFIQTLSSQRFHDWYETGRFDTWIQDSEAGVSERDIMEDICEFFNLRS